MTWSSLILRERTVALIVTPDGFPLAYEVMDGNTSDKTTLKEFLAKIEKQYGKAKRTGPMSSPSKSPIALCSNQCLCNLHSLPGEINW